MRPCPILESGAVRHGLAARRRRRGDSFYEMGQSLAPCETKRESFVFMRFRRGKEGLSDFKPSEG